MTPASVVVPCRWAFLWMLLFQLCAHYVATEVIDRKVYRVGATVLLKPSSNVSISKIDDVSWKWNDKPISKKLRITHQNTDKYTLIKNSTLQIHDGRKADSGNYSVNIYDSTGLQLAEEKTHLTFLDPVFGFSFWTTCSEKGNISITCSVVSGDDVQFVWTWTLNGTSESKASSGESQNLTIQFEDVIPEDLTCKASNAVSEIRARAPVCRGYLSTLAASVVFLSSLSGVGVLTLMRQIKKDDIKATEENIYLDMRGYLQNRTTPEQSRTSSPKNSTHDLSSLQSCSLDTGQEDVYVL
ncbi:hypothetical protein NFI96_027229 [Prochilodus magdalenae]|nr:hypothetical protein NFI96_027229 [Prochilodus magdalenae]